MVFSSNAAIGTGGEVNLFGATNATTTELNTQAAVTQNATFSKLGTRIIGGGSGTNTITFRKNGADGSEVATRSGTGDASDATNSDALTTGDLFNLTFTNSGTNPLHSWIKANIEFGTGHGSIHGAAAFAGTNWTSDSATRFFALSGNVSANGIATESLVQFKSRAYSTWASMQARVTANARTSTTTYANRINGVSGAAACAFGAGVSGLVQDTSVGDSIATGDLLSVACTSGAGAAEALTATFISSTFTVASGAKSDCIAADLGGLIRAASATAHYFTLGGRLASLTAFTEAQARVPIGFSGNATNIRVYLAANTYTVGGTLTLYKNGTATALVATLTALGGAAWYEDATNSVSFTDTDELSCEVVGGTTGSATIQTIALTLEDTGAAVTETLFRKNVQGLGAGVGRRQAA